LKRVETIRFHLKWMLPTSNLPFQPVSNHFTLFRPVSTHFRPFHSKYPFLLHITFKTGLHNLGLLETDSPNLYSRFDTTMSPISFHYLSHPPWGYWGLYSKKWQIIIIMVTIVPWCPSGIVAIVQYSTRCHRPLQICCNRYEYLLSSQPGLPSRR
jgi:hypothetical protein